MQAAGLDGIELEGYGHLIDGFWSPATNRRTTSTAAASRTGCASPSQVLDAIRAAVGPDFIVGIRMVCRRGAGTRASRARKGSRSRRRLVARGQVDFLNVIRGHIDTDAALADVIPIQGTPAAPHLDFAGEVRAALGIPVFHAARINDVATARHAIASGKLDMVGMTRAHIADPHIARKVARGREQRHPALRRRDLLPRPDLRGPRGALHPQPGDRPRGDHAARGRQRPTGRRGRSWWSAPGPAGLEAARVAAERGHEVVLFEAAAQPGGQIRLAARARRRAEMLGIVDWRVARVRAAGRRAALQSAGRGRGRAGRGARRGDRRDRRPAQRPAARRRRRTSSSRAGTSCRATRRPGQEVLLYDDNGAHPGLQAAEQLAEAGAKLEIVTPERIFAPEIGGLNHVAYARCFQEHGVRITINSRLRAVAPRRQPPRRRRSAATMRERTEERLVDQVVVEHGTLPLDELYFALKEQSVNRGEVDYRALIAGRPQSLVGNPEGRFRLFRIGDAVASRNIHAAIYDALRLCKDL